MLSVKGLELSYGDKKIFDRFDLEVGDGEVVCILGRSGCGKTSLLNCVAGALAHGGEVEGTERGVAYLFQEPRLIPALTAAENVRFAVGHLYADRAALNAEIDRVFDSLGIDGLQDRPPGKMSGGQAARVALARALCHPSDVLLTDEPFGALDIALKLSLTEYLISALKQSASAHRAHGVARHRRVLRPCRPHPRPRRQSVPHTVRNKHRRAARRKGGYRTQVAKNGRDKARADLRVNTSRGEGRVSSISSKSH